VQPMIETDSLAALWSQVRSGTWSTVVPHTFLLLLGEPVELTALPLVDPIGSHVLGLVASSRDPLTPMTRALLGFAQDVDLVRDIELRIDRHWRRAALSAPDG
jgi:DNA-binding transcriptional LysR family regulator